MSERNDRRGAGVAPTAPQDDVDAAQRTRRRLLLWGIPLFWGSLYVYNAYLSTYARSLGASLSLVGIIVAAYGFTQLVLRIPIGIASDRLGRRKPFVLAGALAGALSSASMLIAPEPWVLVLGRALAGVAAACWVPLSVLLVDSYPKGQVVRATSMATALSAVGMTVASAAGGQLAQVAGERPPFVVGIVLGVFTALLLVRVVEPPAATSQPMSLGTLLAVGRTRLLLVVSVLGLLNQYISWAMTQGFVPIYAADLGATKAELGILMSVWQATYAVVSLFGALIAARLGTRWTVALGMALTTVATLLTPMTHSLVPLMVLRFVHGAGVGVVTPVLMAGVVFAVPEAKRGAAMGFYQSIYAIGMVAGPAISGVFGDALGLSTTFVITGLIGLVATVLAIVLLPHTMRQAT